MMYTFPVCIIYAFKFLQRNIFFWLQYTCVTKITPSIALANRFARARVCTLKCSTKCITSFCVTILLFFIVALLLLLFCARRTHKPASCAYNYHLIEPLASTCIRNAAAARCIYIVPTFAIRKLLRCDLDLDREEIFDDH